jgi:hypothetical protein
MARPNDAPHTPMRPRSAVIAGMIIAAATLLVFVDMSLAGRAEHLYWQARQVAEGRARVAHMRRDLHKGWIIVHADHVPASLCYALTGGLRFSVLLPRSRHVQAEHPTVSSARGNCVAGDANTLLFTFSATSP